MTDLAYLTAAELTARYARRELSPQTVTRHILARSEQLKAFARLTAEQALATARASEARWQRDEPLGPLDGVPVSVAELLSVRTTSAAGPWAEGDAPALARLREAGAVLLGETTDAAAATAAGLGVLAIATDDVGGSIRVPSAVVALRPTFGRVPTYPAALVGIPAQIGPIARSVDDLALALAMISRADVRDPLQPPRLDDPRAYPRILRDLRIGYSATLGYAQLDAEVARAFERAIEALRESGATLEAADPGFASPAPIVQRLFSARAAWTVRQLSAAQRDQLKPGVAAAAGSGERLSAVDYLNAEAERLALVQIMARYHETFDLLLTPTSASAAPIMAADAALTAPFSLTRQPALTMPCGLTQAGLPIGLQIVGRHFQDATVLAAARTYERLQPFRASAL